MVSRRDVLLGLAGTAVSLPAAARDFWRAPPADGPAEFLFGYGTLISEPSRTSTSRRQVPAVPARIAGSFGYVRGFVARAGVRRGAGFTALGLRRPQSGEDASSINGVVFPVLDATEMAAFDRRESGYERVEVDPAFIEAAAWQGLPRGGRIWIYVPRGRSGIAGQDTLVPDADFPLVQSYIDVVLQGALSVGPQFAQELVATAFDWSPFWLDDRPTPRRPWAGTEQAGAIDRLLSTVEPAAGQFANRLYPEIYAVRHLAGRNTP